MNSPSKSLILFAETIDTILAEADFVRSEIEAMSKNGRKQKVLESFNNMKIFKQFTNIFISSI